MIKKLFIVSALLCCSFFDAIQAQEAMIGEVRMFAGNFAPRGWALCQGQLLPISQNQALFSILGTTYGGDGRTSFGLPDLRGRVPMGNGSGPGLTPRRLGEKRGTETNVLTINNLPSHGHDIPVIEMDPNNTKHSFQKGSNSVISVGNSANRTVKSNYTGGSQSVNNIQPTLTINYIICLQGIYPSRN